MTVGVTVDVDRRPGGLVSFDAGNGLFLFESGGVFEICRVEGPGHFENQWDA